MPNQFIIRNAKASEYTQIGELLFDVYANLDGFPKPDEQPGYYSKLKAIGSLIKNNQVELIVATDHNNTLLGTVLFFRDMKYYGSRGIATQIENAAGFRFLGVSLQARGLGIGKKLTNECIRRAKEMNLNKVIIHSTKAMETAWEMYLDIGFKRATDLDFSWDGFGVYGFELDL